MTTNSLVTEPHYTSVKATLPNGDDAELEHLMEQWGEFVRAKTGNVSLPSLTPPGRPVPTLAEAGAHFRARLRARGV